MDFVLHEDSGKSQLHYLGLYRSLLIGRYSLVRALEKCSVYTFFRQVTPTHVV